MKTIRMIKTVAALVFVAGFSFISCKDKASESSGNSQGIETADSYDETKAPTGEPGNDAMNPGADGGTGMPYDSTSTKTESAPDGSRQ